MQTKIALYGFGSMPVAYRYMIDMARVDGVAVEWCAILTTPHYRALLREVLPAPEILDVFRDLPRHPVGGAANVLEHYDGSLAADLASVQRQWRRRSGKWLHDRGIDYYRMYKAFLSDRSATHLLTTGIETPDAKIIVAAARELGLGVLAPVDMRNLTGTMFTSDSFETPPNYAIPSADSRQRATAFISMFRNKWAPARGEPRDVDPATDDRAIMPTHLPPLRQRLLGFVRTALERPDIFDPVFIRDAVMSNSKLMQGAIWGTRQRLNAPMYHVATPNGLPSKFIFYPLQYTPESSINVPAPYYVDQFRVIDALRFAMPSDCTLVVKEHRTCLPIRPVSFMRRIMGVPGVVVADSRISARELVERAALTVSVTGTAAFEAFIAGYGSMALGPGMSAWTLGGTVAVGQLAQGIRDRMDMRPSDKVVVDRIATLFSARYPFFFATPHMPGEPMLRCGNLRRYLSAVLDHIARDRANAAAPFAVGGKHH
jgi:hypothetical protein